MIVLIVYAVPVLFIMIAAFVMAAVIETTDINASSESNMEAGGSEEGTRNRADDAIGSHLTCWSCYGCSGGCGNCGGCGDCGGCSGCDCGSCACDGFDCAGCGECLGAVCNDCAGECCAAIICAGCAG